MRKTLFITGASSGIGRAAVKVFAVNGWNVIATMRNPGAGAELSPLGNVLVARLDVQDRISIGKAISAGIARFGKIDVLVNNAGYGQYGLFETIPREKIQEQFDVNVFGVMDVTRAILPHFRKNKSGLIVNISSGAGIFTLPMASIYCAGKFALEGFSEALAYELASLNIGVKLVEPHGGVTDTRFSDRSARENVPDTAVAEYDEFIDGTNKAFARMAAARTISSHDVALVIYGAATDGADRLRYLVGDDTRGFINARQNMSDQAYVEFMRSHFETKP
jgi:NAD(P)-dependent dehydrogenase (short-subunit alcohol dehydrogenase family)